MKLVLSTICCFFFAFSAVLSQDTQYSQFYAAPLRLNPALTAFFNGNFRLASVYRNQWKRSLEKPITSFTFNGDMRFVMDVPTNRNPDFWGAGLMFATDRAGDFGLNTTTLNLSAAYHKALDKQFNQYLSLGFSIGVFQRNLSYGNVLFEDQFDGVRTYSLPTEEFIPGNNFGYSDFSLGLHYSISPFDQLQISVGGAMHHLFEPNVSFFQDEEVSVVNITDVPLQRKYQTHLTIRNNVTESFSYSPRIMFVAQGKHQQMLVGVNFRKEVIESNRRAFQFGIWARPVREFDRYNIAAAVFMLGIELDRLNFGLSYDVNTSSLRNNILGQNSFEFSIRYIGEYQNDDFFCPEF